MKRSEAASRKEEEVYEFLLKYTTEHLFPPTVEEIVKGTTFTSTSTVYTVLNRLEEVGKVEITRGTPRGIKLTGYEMVQR